MKTTIINIKKTNLNKSGYDDLVDWLKDTNHMYIGRNMSYYVKGADGSKWRNPFSVKKYGREECLTKYETYIKSSDLYNDLDELKGRTLGCWCKPESCHGDILIKLLKAKN
jgi:hypothetical protein